MRTPLSRWKVLGRSSLPISILCEIQETLAEPYVLTGTLKDEQTVTLDEALPLTSGKVRLTLEALQPEPRRPYLEVMADIRRRQRARGHQPRSREEVDAYLSAERSSWDR